MWKYPTCSQINTTSCKCTRLSLNIYTTWGTHTQNLLQIFDFLHTNRTCLKYETWNIYIKLLIDWLLMIDSGVCTSCKTTYKCCPGRGKMAASCRGSTVDRHLEETILRLSSHLTEMERHRVTANVAMCELFIRRTEDYARLLRVFI